MYDRLDLRGVRRQPLEQGLRQDEVGEGYAREIAPLVPLAQPVTDGHPRAAGSERGDDVRSDETRAPGDDDHTATIHRSPPGGAPGRDSGHARPPPCDPWRLEPTLLGEPVAPGRPAPQHS